MHFKPLSEDHPLAKELELADRVEARANELLAEHGLEDWTYRLSRTATFLGRCFYSDRVIEFSEHFLAEPWEEIIDTVLHEIGHALAYVRYGEQGKGHGYLWKYVCREIGARPERTKHTTVPSKPYNYVMKCPTCGARWYRYRMRGRNFGSRCPSDGTEVKIYRLKKG